MTSLEGKWGPDGFLDFVWRCACAVPGCLVSPVDAAHAVSRGAGGTWTDILPMCRQHHREQHNLGVQTFQARYGFDMKAAAAATQERWHELHGFDPEPPKAA